MSVVSQKQQILQDIKKFVLSKASIVYILSDEEDRVEGLLKELAATFQPRPKLFIWNPFQGLTGESETIENSRSPLEGLDKVIQRSDQCFYVFEGVHSFLKTDAMVIRKLKDVHRLLRNRYSTLFIIAPYLVIPEDLHRRARAVAALRGDNISEVVCKALQEYIAESAQEAADVRIAREIRESIDRGEEPTYLHDEIWAEIRDLMPHKSTGNM